MFLHFAAANRMSAPDGATQTAQTMVALTKLTASRQSSAPVSESTVAQTGSSPRPGILRKRAHESTLVVS